MPCLGVGSASEGGAASPQLADQRRGASACEPRGGKGDGAPIAMEALQLAAVLGRLFEIKVCAQKKRVILERETTGHWLPRLFMRNCHRILLLLHTNGFITTSYCVVTG